MTKCTLNFASRGNTVVEHLTHNPTIKCLNPVSWHWKRKCTLNFGLGSSPNTVVEHLTHNSKIKGSNSERMALG
jgi:hypothetical protein